MASGNVVVHFSSCEHPRKALMRSTTTNWPPPVIFCMECGQTLITIEDARRFVAAADVPATAPAGVKR